MGAIQCTCGGPRLVQAKPNRPIASSGAAAKLSVLVHRYKTVLKLKPTVKQPVQAPFGLKGVRVLATSLPILVYKRPEGHPRKEVSKHNTVVRQEVRGGGSGCINVEET